MSHLETTSTEIRVGLCGTPHDWNPAAVYSGAPTMGKSQFLSLGPLGWCLEIRVLSKYLETSDKRVLQQRFNYSREARERNPQATWRIGSYSLFRNIGHCESGSK